MNTTDISSAGFALRVGGFVCLTFIISYLVGAPFNMALTPVVKDTDEVSSVLLPRLIIVYGPAIAAIVLTNFGAGPFSTKTLLSKLIPQRKHLWWCISMPFIFILITFVSFVIAGVSSAQLAQFLIEDWHWLVYQLVAQFLIVGIGEELGWRGWLLPILAQRYTVITCVALTTAIWGLWHFPIFFAGYQIVVPWLMMLVALGFITTWLWYKVDGNVFVLAVMHASFNGSEVFLENRLTYVGRGNELALAGWTTLGYIYLLLTLVVIIGNRKLWITRLT